MRPSPKALLVVLLLAAGCRLAMPVVDAGPFSGELPTPLAGDRIRVLVDLRPQVDLRRLGAALGDRRHDRRDRRERVATALRRLADRTQAPLEPRLEALRRRGLVAEWRGFSIVNRLLVVATPEGVRALARWPEVAAVAPETESQEPAWTTAPGGTTERPRRSWALDAIRVDGAWRRGLDGRGVVVGIIDSGASAVHEQLRDGFRGGEDSWYDPVDGRGAPIDRLLGHGTGVLSVAVGRNVAGRALGVAPGARWIACAALPDGNYNNVLMTECADWMLNVGRPDVLINAWSLPEPGCDGSLRRIVDAWRAAEILPVFAAGNYGTEPGSDPSPANYADLYPGGAAALSVGGVNASGGLFAGSSTGPNSCDGSIFPMLVAPAEDLLAALPLTASTYVVTQGTSPAAGLVAGAAALLLQHDPESSVGELEAALRAGAVDLGPAGADSRFGYGRLDVPRALEALSRLRDTAESKPAAAAPKQR